ncbi:Beta-glucosidase-related glycosidase [Ignavibacterium album JCM 16511]|uniref:Beta-glucosidase-related glycosidase n=2 Tax=Ignavibacterium album TaxID=591197 RepID=I0AMU0_IGNAJ|nr:Beta-glucosidase-related glycosidase [Ignavibacterium album JCM 16511]
MFSQNTNNIDIRIEELLNQLTLEEKIDLLGGTGFETKPIERLGIPPLNMCDGPLGVRWGQATAFPSGILMGATWNPDLISKLGSALAEEVKAKGRHVILGPCVNIARLPMGGRNFESFGEDPYLTSRIAVDYIKGVQKENVAATIKHFAANNQEHERMFVDVQVDERALNEIYFPAFKAAVEEANVLAFMSAYNKLNGHYCSENEYLLKEKLKGEWKFKGLVMSDWGAVHSSIPTFNNGLDLEMPEGKYLNRNSLLTKLKSGELSEEVLNDKVKRILRVMFSIGLFDEYKSDSAKINTDEHKQIALEVAKEGIVLLKNQNNILPLNKDELKSIAVIGPTSNIAITGGGGSSMVSTFYAISPLEALEKKLGDKVKIIFAQGISLNGTIRPIKTEFLFTNVNGNENGLIGEYFTNKDLNGEPARVKVDKIINFDWEWDSSFEDFPSDNFSVRWTGYLKVDKTNTYTIDVSSDDGVRLFLDEKLVIDDWNDHAEMTNSYTTRLEAGRFYKIKLEFYENGGAAICRLGLREENSNLLANAISVAKNSDVALVFVGTNYTYESEGFDRQDLILPQNQDELIKKIVEVNPRTIVVLTTGSPVLMNEWIDKVPAVLESWFAGEQIGNAIADIIFGEANPSGKLPITFPLQWEDCSAFETYKKEEGVSKYDDGIFVGYRHFEKNNIKPLFPFGFGLSYTQFGYSDIKVTKNILTSDDSLTVSFKIKNIGTRKGKEVAQLYVSDPVCSVERPVKELKRFAKVELNPGEVEEISFTIFPKDLMFYDNHWKIENGEFILMIGSSSSDIKLKSSIKYYE